LHSRGQDENGRSGSQTAKNQHKVIQKAELFGNNPVSKQKEDKKVIDNGDASPYSGLEDRRSMLLPDEQKILSALTWEPRPIDDVIAETGIPSARMLATLTLLQVKGMVQQHPGKHISLK
jgi:predicted Rossmann fold nucleotide-binding protein DprA/Smf involved in DNA uptake